MRTLTMADYNAIEPCVCGSKACRVMHPGDDRAAICPHGGSGVPFGRRAEQVDAQTVTPCGTCGSRACAAQSPTGCRHGGGAPRPAPGAVVQRPDGVVQDVTLTGAGRPPVFKPTARGGGKGVKR